MNAGTDELAAVQARARAWAQVLRLPLRRRRWRGQSGGLAGTGAGSSLEFHDQRAYLPGDDPRQINWQAYARTGQPVMKVFQEEVRPLVDIVLDASASQFAHPAKRLRTLELLAFALESALASAAAVRVHAVAGTAFCGLEVEALLSGRWTDCLARLPAADAEGPPALARLPLRAGSLRVLICDLLFPAEPLPLLADLCQRQGRAVVFAPWCVEEAAPGWQGDYEFVDAETAAAQPHRMEPEGMKRYLAAYARHFALWKDAAQKQAVPLARVESGVDFLKAMQAEGLPAGAVELA